MNEQPSDTTTATVEVLTAEVHVLKVGSRQITQSVAKQLDRRRWTQIEPFGRIRIGDTTNLIGRDKETGALVTSAMPSLGRTPWVDLEEDSILVCSAEVPIPRRDDGYRFRISHRGLDRVYEVSTDAVVRCQFPSWDKELHASCVTMRYQAEGVANAISEALDDHDAYVAAVRVLHEMPLIVLAGLR